MYPIIVKITQQHIVSQYPMPEGGHTTIWQDEGICRDGKRWRWNCTHHTSADGGTTISSGHNYVQIGEAQSGATTPTE